MYPYEKKQREMAHTQKKRRPGEGRVRRRSDVNTGKGKLAAPEVSKEQSLSWNLRAEHGPANTLISAQ